MIIYHSILTIAWAYYLHHRAPDFNKLLGPGWAQIAAYVTGTGTAMPSLLIAFALVSDLEGEELRRAVIHLFIAWGIAYTAYGLGVVLGWIVTPYPVED